MAHTQNIIVDIPLQECFNVYFECADRVLKFKVLQNSRVKNTEGANDLLLAINLDVH